MSADDPLIQTDSELLMQYVRTRDDQAFHELVTRHGALVMSVCQQVLQDKHDAEDAFQATFLILSRKADRMLHFRTVAGWLHKVAFRIALRARRQRRRRREVDHLEPNATCDAFVLNRIHLQHLTCLLHEELAQLPSQYREVIIFCDLYGASRAEAADSLDRSESSVKAALARGRRLLRRRMLRRGAALSVACLTTSRSLASTAINASLVDSTLILVNVKPSNRVDHKDSIFSLAEEGIGTMRIASVGTVIGMAAIVFFFLAVPFRVFTPAAAHERPNELNVVLEVAEDDPAQPVKFRGDANTDDTASKTKEELLAAHYRLLEKSLRLKRESLSLDLEGERETATTASIKRAESEIAMLDAEIAMVAVQQREVLDAAIVPDTSSQLKPGDRIDVAFLDQGLSTSWSRRTTILADGRIILPFVGQVEAGGVTVHELTKRLAELYRPVLHDSDRGILVTFAGTSEPLYNVVK